MKKTIVPNAYVGLLYEDGVFQRTLEPGKYKLKRHLFDKRLYAVDLVDMRERSLVIKGQEILTRDKVALRVSLQVYFKVVDAVAASHNVADYAARIYEDVQLAARRYLASKDLDAILSDRNEISDAVRQDVRDAALSYGVEIRRADVKDLVFPGNLREIMNQVLETERRAEAKLIQAKKEIEARELEARAQIEAEQRRVEAERARVQLELAAQRERLAAEAEKRRAELQAEIETAKAAADNPELVTLRQVNALIAMATHGGRFVVGIDRSALGSVLKDEQ